jgi:hypothetical protein
MLAGSATLHLKDNVKSGQRHPTHMTVPTIDERRVVAIGASCEQRKEEIEVQKQDAFRKELHQ